MLPGAGARLLHTLEWVLGTLQGWGTSSSPRLGAHGLGHPRDPVLQHCLLPHVMAMNSRVSCLRAGGGHGPLPASLMGQGQGWGRGWLCRGCWCWRRNPCPQGPWLDPFAFPHKPDSRGIFIPQRIFLIRRLHNSLSRTHARPLGSISSKALPTHPAAAPVLGHRGGIAVALQREGGADPRPSPRRGDPAPPRAEPGEERTGAHSCPPRFASLMRSVLRRLRRTLEMGFIILPERERRLCFPSPCPVPPLRSGDVPAR